MAGRGDGYVGNALDTVRIRRLQKQRETERRKIEELKTKTAAVKGQNGLLQFGSGTSEQIHGQIIKKGDAYARNEDIETKLVIFYSKCGNLDNANKLFARLSSKNVFSWAAMIGLNSSLGLNEQALLGYCQILDSAILPENFIIPSVFKACGANQCVLFGRGVHGYVIKAGFEGCVYVASSLVDMYGKFGILEDAKNVFHGMSDRNVVVQNTMITSYVQNGMNEEAIQMYTGIATDAQKVEYEK